MTKDRLLSVFLIVRNSKLCMTLSGTLVEAGYSVFGYRSARDFLDDKKNHSRGIVLAEVRLPGITGLELANLLASERETFQIVLISNYADIPKTASSGVDFICGPPTPEAVTAAVKRTLVPEQYKEKSLRWAFEHLSQKEAEVLAKILAGMSSGDIAKEMDLSMKTVEAHRGRIRSKTGANDVSELVRMWTAYRKLN